MSLNELNNQFKIANEVLEALHLKDDTSIQDQMAHIEIELEAALFKLPETDPEVNRQLKLIHLEKLTASLYKVIEGALGYYALVDQVKGSNEPLIGSAFARELLEKIKNTDLDLIILKDELHDVTNPDQS